MEVLYFLRKDTPVPVLLKEVVKVLAERTGFETVGLRLKDGDDYPFFETRGMSEQFIRLENSLCPGDHSGNPGAGESGGEPLECVCGAVIEGKIEYSKPYFTEFGSFWSNCNGRLLDEYPELRKVIRGNCVREGYESSAIIPLRLGAQTFGLLLFEDKRPDMLPADLVRVLESIAVSLALALSQRQHILELCAQNDLLETRVRRRSRELSDSNERLRLEISRMKRTELALRESEERFRSLFQNSPVAYQSLDVDGRYIDVNNELCRLMGYSESELLGKCFGEFWSEETKEKFRAAFEDFKRSGQGRAELSLRSKKGAPVAVILDGRVQKDDRGSFIRTHCTLTDITGRKQAENEVKKQQETLTRIFESAPYIMMVVDRENRVDNINRKGIAFAGKDKMRLLGLWGGDVLACLNSFKAPGCGRNPECGYCIIRNSVRQTFESGHGVNDQEGRLMVRRLSGDVPVEILISTVLVDVRDEDKVLVTISDITERKRALLERERLQAQLMRAHRIEAIGRLAGGVAHDFNNMLGVILGHAEMAMESVKPDDSIYSDLREIRTAGVRSAQLTRQLLAFARKQSVEPKLLDINDTVSSMLKMLQRLIGENIDLTWTPGRDVLKVKMDPSQVDQMLVNLAVNARDAINGVGKIAIETSNAVIEEPDCPVLHEAAPGEYLLLCFGDSGVGMSKEVTDHIFEPFFTTKEVGKGTGLGLATVYGIIKQNNGFVHVNSEPGKGTIFRIYLPGAKGETGETEVVAAAKSLTGTETVLLVEDEQAMLNLGEMVLKRLGYTVLAADNPEEAIRLATRHTGDIQLLVTDVVMPEMNGKELAQRIGAIKPAIRCLFMSGYTDDVIGRQGIIEEGLDFLQKPFSVKSLVDKVREVLDREHVL